MSAPDNGGPAFPVNVSTHPDFDGMTLRDYFAIRAFQTRFAKYNDWTLDELTDQAYRDADAMLAARSKTA